MDTGQVHPAILGTNIYPQLRKHIPWKLGDCSNVTRRRSQVAGTAVASASQMTPAAAGARLRRMAAVAVDAVAPDRLVRRAVTRHGDTLSVDGRSYALSRNVYVVGAGKAVLGMLAATEELVRPHLVRGLLSVPVGATRGQPPPPPQVRG